MWANHLTRGSSPVDWCEDNYTFSPLIGKLLECYYTISSSEIIFKHNSFIHYEHYFKLLFISAEFFNTVSNIIFLVMPPFLMRLHRPYAQSMGPGIHVIWLLLIVVGASSAYFHATLSLLGQLLDEMAILWVVMAGFAMWYPKAAMPPSMRDKEGRRTFITFVSKNVPECNY